MKIVYIHQHFATNEGATGTRSYDVGRHLVNMGHQVTVICGVHALGGFKPIAWWRPWQVQWLDGIKVIVCNVPYGNQMSVPARMWSFVAFMLWSTLACLVERDVDLIFATSTPLTVGIPGRIGAAFKRVPYIFEVRDLWPEDLLAAGRLKPGMQYRAWEWLESFSYQRASKILLVSKGFHDRLLERGFPPGLLRTILLGADADLFKELTPDTEYLREHGLDGRTIAIYTGAHGDANGLGQVLDAAEKLLDRPDIAIVLIGEGKARDSLRRAAGERQLTNVHLLDAVTKTKLPGILAGCHIGLMILKQIIRPRWVTPNKIFDYMFAGLPTIVNFPGTTAELVAAEGVGVATAPGSADELARQIRHWADHPEEARGIGRHAREVAFAKFDRHSIARALADEFEAVVREHCATHGE